MRAPLAVLDLVPIVSGGTSRRALLDSVDLARRAEAAGYARYWLAEHPLNQGIAGSAPHTLLAALGAATDRIRIGTAVTVLGNYEPLQVAEAFGTLAQLYGPRIDLGLGRSGVPRPGEGAAAVPVPAGGQDPALAANRVVDGLVVPPARAFPIDRERLKVQFELLGRSPGDGDAFGTQVNALLSFFAGTYLGPQGARLPAEPASGSEVDVWVHGSTGGESARVAGSLGLPYGANYHVAPSGVLESVAAYREHFRPGVLREPHVIVSVDAVVAPTDADARRMGLGYGQWVHSIRAGSGAIEYPSPDEALAAPLDPAAAALVQDRLDTRFVGSPATVVARLETLQRATGADELLVTTIAHDHAARVRSYELLADAWLG
jgi:alkanesulfonate monooxygenase SsuD/methylene tetrahydromethanopterin reductase-like flavin-dependent oxidoreductase (luciferase family)